MQVAKIINRTHVDGPGRRTALFLQGCSIRCPGCQNAHLWPAGGGRAVPVPHLAACLIATGLPLTISGGEPFDQAEDLARLLRLLRAAERHVIIYTGYTFEQLSGRDEPAVHEALGLADVLVDGPYVADLDHARLQYRGSANQRAIDLPATLQGGRVVTLGWDTPEIVITETGNVLGAESVLEDFSELGPAGDARRCGQTERKTR
jgi:anaerobic ribonucleoside-triphosphate reductase activating protein